MSIPIRKRSQGRKPYDPSPCDKADVYAIKALASGTANDMQQKRALDWILRIACGVGDTTYYPDSERDSAFASGKRFVGMEIVAILNLKAPASDL